MLDEKAAAVLEESPLLSLRPCLYFSCPPSWVLQQTETQVRLCLLKCSSPPHSRVILSKCTSEAPAFCDHVIVLKAWWFDVEGPQVRLLALAFPMV